MENPGKTARTFIDGNRIEHYKPLLLAFVLSGISTFISFKILGLYDILVNHYSSSTPNLNTQFMTEYLSFLSSYNSILTLLALPVLAFMTRLVLRKWGHNYYEHIVMNAYILSFYTIVSIIILYPIMYFLKQDFNAIMLVSSFSTLLIPFILIWFYKGFYPGKTLKGIIGKTLSIVGLIILSYIGVIIFGGIIGSVFAVIKGPEALDYAGPI